MKMFTDFTENYASLGDDGEIQTFEGGDQFWGLTSAELDKIGENWLITEFHFEEDWRTWEMHPHGKELVYLLAGEMDLITEKDGNLNTLELRGKGAVVIPQGTWHTAKVFAPSDMLVITFGKGTEIRPLN